MSKSTVTIHQLATYLQICAFARQNPTEARRIFDAAIAKETDPDRIADIELAREYACNQSFRSSLADDVSRRVDTMRPVAK